MEEWRAPQTEQEHVQRKLIEVRHHAITTRTFILRFAVRVHCISWSLKVKLYLPCWVQSQHRSTFTVYIQGAMSSTWERTGETPFHAFRAIFIYYYLLVRKDLLRTWELLIRVDIHLSLGVLGSVPSWFFSYSSVSWFILPCLTALSVLVLVHLICWWNYRHAN